MMLLHHTGKTLAFLSEGPDHRWITWLDEQWATPGIPGITRTMQMIHVCHIILDSFFLAKVAAICHADVTNNVDMTTPASVARVVHVYLFLSEAHMPIRPIHHSCDGIRKMQGKVLDDRLSSSLGPMQKDLTAVLQEYCSRNQGAAITGISIAQSACSSAPRIFPKGLSGILCQYSSSFSSAVSASSSAGTASVDLSRPSCVRAHRLDCLR